jgi:hypothetical protein
MRYLLYVGSSCHLELARLARRAAQASAITKRAAGHESGHGKINAQFLGVAFSCWKLLAVRWARPPVRPGPAVAALCQ